MSSGRQRCGAAPTLLVPLAHPLHYAVETPAKRCSRGADTVVMCSVCDVILSFTPRSYRRHQADIVASLRPTCGESQTHRGLAVSSLFAMTCMPANRKPWFGCYSGFKQPIAWLSAASTLGGEVFLSVCFRENAMAHISTLLLIFKTMSMIFEQ